MKVLLLFFSITVAFLSIAFKDTIITSIESLTSDFYNTNTTAFKGLPLIPPRAIYGAPKPANMTIPRAIRKVFLAIEQSEGAGARVRRSIGTPQLRNFSPFLMLDHFTIKPGAGFPDHAHRGQETYLRICTEDDPVTNVHTGLHTCSKALSTTKTSLEMREQSRREIYSS